MNPLRLTLIAATCALAAAGAVSIDVASAQVDGSISAESASPSAFACCAAR